MALVPSAIRANRSGGIARGRAAPYDRGPKPSTKNTYGGLVKQTFSTLVRMNDDSSVKWHVVAYFTSDSHSNIPGVKDDPVRTHPLFVYSSLIADHLPHLALRLSKI